ncbi:hypothetical protein NBRC116602_09680 [Hyphomicrobiales bacterium 4NK60-0047b]
MSDMIRNTGVYQRLSSSTNELERMFKEVDEKKTPIDIKKVLLIIGLGTLSWVSTYSGLLELITANSGDIGFTYKLAIGFAVAMLMLMIVYILDQLFAPLNWALRTIFVFGYLFLTLISIGFGFGFYWKFLESRSEATRSAESAVGQVQGSLQAGQSRLEQLESTLTTLTALSLQKANEERTKGNSCPNSRPGDGPRRRLRDNDAKSFSFAGDFVTRRAQTVATEIKQLNGDMAKIASRHPSTVDPATGTRNAFMKSLNQRLDLTITRFNSFRTDPQLKSIRNSLAERSTKTQFPDGKGGTFKCPDNQLQSALRGVVQAFDQLPLLGKPKIAAVEGSEATIEAFRRLASTLRGLMVLKMPPSEDEIREARQKAVRSVNGKKPPLQLTNVQAGLNDRDYIPLAIAVFVDFCLLLVSINRPMDRLKSLVPVMKDARDGPISGILSSFHATHFAGIREEFSLFQHVVFDWGGHYYVAIPLASNDIQAQYLANLFVSLEGRGIVDRAIIPPTFIIRGKLKKMGSSFAEHRAFRLYKFRDGAWSNIVLDAVMGAAKDVAIANANQRSFEKYNPDSDQKDGKSGENEKSANFGSLFDETSLFGQNDQNIKDNTIENTSLYSEGQDDQSVMELPRMLRKVGGKDQPQSHGAQTHNNVIAPATFQNTAFNNKRQNPVNQRAPYQGAQNSGRHMPPSEGGQIQRPPLNNVNQTPHSIMRADQPLQKASQGNQERANQPFVNKQTPYNPIGIRPIDTEKKQPEKNGQPPQITEEMKQQSEILNKETKDKEAAQKAEEASVSLTKEDLTSQENVENENIVSLVHEEQENISEENTEQQNVKILSETVQTTQKADKIEDLAPAEQISKKLEALQDNLTTSEAEKNKKAITEVKDPKTAEEEPELAHIAVGKITNWFAKDNNSAPTDEKGKNTDEEKEV